MKLFLLFACATNAASPDSLATLDTANQNLASTKGNFQQVEIMGNSRRKLLPIINGVTTFKGVTTIFH